MLTFLFFKITIQTAQKYKRYVIYETKFQLIVFSFICPTTSVYHYALTTDIINLILANKYIRQGLQEALLNSFKLFNSLTKLVYHIFILHMFCYYLL